MKMEMESVAACAQSKDDREQTKTTKYERRINRWSCVTVHQVYLVVQLGLGRNSCITIHTPIFRVTYIEKSCLVCQL
jgi:hypothetical protein